MCGIIGYTGTQQAKNLLIRGLKRMKYRGYDSAGIAVQTALGLNVRQFLRLGVFFLSAYYLPNLRGNLLSL